MLSYTDIRIKYILGLKELPTQLWLVSYRREDEGDQRYLVEAGDAVEALAVLEQFFTITVFSSHLREVAEGHPERLKEGTNEVGLQKIVFEDEEDTMGAQDEDGWIYYHDLSVVPGDWSNLESTMTVPIKQVLELDDPMPLLTENFKKSNNFIPYPTEERYLEMLRKAKADLLDWLELEPTT